MVPADLDDLPPEEPTAADQQLWRSLERSLGKLFFEGCSGVLQGLLTSCVWHFQNQGFQVTLAIHCPDSILGSRVVNHLPEISRVLERLTPSAQVQIHTPTATCVEVEVHLGQFSVP